jgi:magnesium transporter
MSAWAAIFAVITVLAGIYGMNFANMPELRWSIGYPLVLLVMAGLSVMLYRRFKKSGWL